MKVTLTRTRTCTDAPQHSSRKYGELYFTTHTRAVGLPNTNTAAFSVYGGEGRTGAMGAGTVVGNHWISLDHS